jgi:hypothetical protein
MLYFPRGKGYVSNEYAVAASASIAAEGQALVADTTAGVFGVKPGSATAGEKFMGVAVGQQITISSLARVEEYVVPAGAAVTLKRTPSGGTVSVWDQTAAAVIAAGGGGWTLSGAVLTVQAGHVGHTITVFFKYAVTVAESRAIQGDQFPGGPAGNVVSQIGAIKNGVVFTSEFDSTVNWNATNPTVTLGANGQFTIGGTGTAIQAVVVQAPTASSPYLGLDLQY